MASTLSSATMTVRIAESIKLNGVEQGNINTLKLTGINDIFKRIITCPVTETVLYECDASAVAGSKFDVDNIQYVRITNKDDTNSVDLIIEATDEIGLKLPAGKSLILFDHTTLLEGSAGDVTIQGETAATADLTVADGDEAASGQFTEGEYVKFISTSGVVGIFILSDSAETGAVSSGTVLSASSDLGTTVPSSSLLAQGTCVAVTMNLNTCTQALLLNELRDTMGASTSPLLNKVSGAAGTVPSSNGNQTLTFTQAVTGSDGNTVTTTDISQLTAADFTGGTYAYVANKTNIVSIHGIANTSAVDLEIFIAST